jgi:hypothetical protein
MARTRASRELERNNFPLWKTKHPVEKYYSSRLRGAGAQSKVQKVIESKSTTVKVSD